MKVKLKNIFVVFLSSILFLFLGFYNNYPFFFSDSGTYILSGLEFKIPIDRPIYYGLFVRHSSLLTSMWYVVFAQSLIVSYLMFFIFKIFFKNNYKLYFLISVVILVLTSGASFHICQIIPDIFTPILILSFLLLLLKTEISKVDTFVISIIFMYSIFTHNSHLQIALLILLFVILLFIFNKKSCQKIFNLKKLLMVFGLFLATLILIPTCNFLISNKFFYSQVSDIFLIQKLSEDGILEKYLNEECENKNYEICKYKDSLTWDLLWDSKSPLNRTGSWLDVVDECHEINKDILTTPKYVKLFSIKIVPHTLEQFFKFNSGGVSPSDCEPASYLINSRFKHENREFYSSKQINGKLNFNTLNTFQNIFIFISFILFFIFYSNKRLMESNDKLKFSIIFILFALLANAFICSTFSTVTDRYQSRVVWLIPLFSLIIIFKLIEYRKNIK